MKQLTRDGLMYKGRFFGDGLQRLVILVILISVAVATVSDYEDRYPVIVEQDRADPSLFVKHPNVLDSVSKIRIFRIRPSPRNGDKHFMYGTKLDRSLKCREHEFVGRKFVNIRTDLPGGFKCGEKNKPFMAYLIPTIRLEAGRIFNVSLDFIKLNTTEQFNSSQSVDRDLPLQLQLSSGIMFLSGLIQTGGSLTISITISTTHKYPPIKVRLNIEKPEKTTAGRHIDIQLEQRPHDLTNQAELFKHRLNALKCISHRLRLATGSLRQISFNEGTDGSKVSVIAIYSLGVDRSMGNQCHHLNTIGDHLNDDNKASDRIEACIDIVLQKVNVDYRECGSIDEDLDTENPLLKISQSDDSVEQENQDDGEVTQSSTATVAATILSTNSPPDSAPIAQNTVTDQSIGFISEQPTETTATGPATTSPIGAEQQPQQPPTVATTLASETTTTVTEAPSTEWIAPTTTTEIPISSTTTMSSVPNIIVSTEEQVWETTPTDPEASLSHESSHLTRPSRKETPRVKPVPNNGLDTGSEQTGSSHENMATAIPDASSTDSSNSVDGYHYGGSNSTTPFLQTTEVYGFTVLACIPLIVVFVILFYKMAKCKDRGEYDPIHTNCSNGLTGPVFVDRADSPLTRRDSRC